jgi:hypothetical protein
MDRETLQRTILEVAALMAIAAILTTIILMLGEVW